VVGANGWLTDREFANSFAVVQAIPGPNMILLTSFIGWKVGGLPAAAAAGLATFGPSCALCFAGYRWWDRFRDAPWQRIVRRGLAPVTVGLVIAGGAVMARIGDASWASLAVTLAAIGIVLGTRLSPLWVIGLGALIGALGLV
jgi:chromate transporter